MVIYPGTFDPITHGHIDVAGHAVKIFGDVMVAVIATTDSAKQTLFSTSERVALARKSLASLPTVTVCHFNSLVVDLAKKHNASVLIRGLRTVSDFDYEIQMAHTNRRLRDNVETVFLVPDERVGFISSSLVKQIASLGGDVSTFVPEHVQRALIKKNAH